MRICPRRSSRLGFPWEFVFFGFAHTHTDLEEWFYGFNVFLRFGKCTMERDSIYCPLCLLPSSLDGCMSIHGEGDGMIDCMYGVVWGLFSFLFQYKRFSENFDISQYSQTRISSVSTQYCCWRQCIARVCCITTYSHFRIDWAKKNKTNDSTFWWQPYLRYGLIGGAGKAS